MRKAAVFVLVTLFLAGCTGFRPSADAERRPSTKLKAYETWDFMSPLGTDQDGERTETSSRLMNSILREMQDLGLRRAKDDPDIQIDFVLTGDGQPGGSYDAESGTLKRANWPQAYSTWPGYDGARKEYPEGTLIVDVIDTKEGALVAEGVAEGQLSPADFHQPRCDSVVHAVIRDIW